MTLIGKLHASAARGYSRWKTSTGNTPAPANMPPVLDAKSMNRRRRREIRLLQRRRAELLQEASWLGIVIETTTAHEAKGVSRLPVNAESALNWAEPVRLGGSKSIEAHRAKVHLALSHVAALLEIEMVGTDASVLDPRLNTAWNPTVVAS